MSNLSKTKDALAHFEALLAANPQAENLQGIVRRIRTSARKLQRRKEQREIKMLGIVTYFDERRGFGFLKSETGASLFFHISTVRGEFEPNKGDRVRFEERISKRTQKLEAF